MNHTAPLFARLWFIPAALLLAALVGVTWANYQFARENPGGNDFLVHWVGTRALLVDGLSPYSDEVAEEIQTRAYGRPAQAGEHQLRVAYPLYGEALFLPFALIADYTLARALWMTALEAGLLALAFFCLRLTGWRPPLWLLSAFLIFSLVWYHGLRPLINGNPVILVALLLAGAFLALRSGRDELAGVLLALATLKPQVVLLPILFILVWTASQRRWRVVLWLVITIGSMSGLAAFFLPDWPIQNLREVLLYPSYNPPGTPGVAFAEWWPATGEKLGWALSALLAILLLGEWAAARRKEFRWFLWTAGLTIAAGQWIGIQTDPGNFIVLFIPLTLIFAVWEERWGRRGQFVILLMMLVLLAGLWALFLRTVGSSGGQPLQHPIMFFPLPAFVIVGLYWVRWWAVRPARLLVEALREYET
ncbi:MAG TPA: glycosyltransferase 87 family protein [Anaerolineales bacterium]|nr:glycosyltransferase 87 family protein [Anaerolineales bacterium]